MTISLLKLRLSRFHLDFLLHFYSGDFNNDDVKVETKKNWRRSQLTVSSFLSNQRLSLSSAIGSVHGDPVTCFRCETIQNCGCGVSPYCLFTSLIAVQRLPGDSILTDVTRGRDPGGEKAGVSDVPGLQVSGWTELCGRTAVEWETQAE